MKQEANSSGFTLAAAMLTILAKSATSMTQKSGKSLLVLKRGPEDKRSSAHTHMLHSRKYTKSCNTRKQNKSLQKMTYFAGKEGKNTKTERTFEWIHFLHDNCLLSQINTL
jgi:hypothetical protein